MPSEPVAVKGEQDSRRRAVTRLFSHHAGVILGNVFEGIDPLERVPKGLQMLFRHRPPIAQDRPTIERELMGQVEVVALALALGIALH